MNYFGSYRKLLANAKAAIISGIEVYNRPRFEYRDELFVILLINGWELILKSLLSKARRSIYYPKVRKQPYRTLSWQDALLRAKETSLWPSGIPWQALQANLRQLNVYRDNAVHFYNAEGFGIVIYGLAQTSIRNFNDLASSVFDSNLADEVNWTLLPIGIAPPVDPVQYLRGNRGGNTSTRTAVDEFLGSMQDQIQDLEDQGVDTGRFMTVFDISLHSVKRIEQADLVVGVDGAAAGGGEPVYIERRVDPLTSHPLRQMNVLHEIGELHGRRFNQYDFQAVVHYRRLRERPEYCWHDPDTNVTRWSRDVLPLIRRQSATQIAEARHALSAARRAGQ